MLAKNDGRLEQTATHYAQALSRAGIGNSTITLTDAPVNAKLDALALHRISFQSWGGYDPFAILKLWHLARDMKADILICHGHHALNLALLGLKDRLPIIYVQQDTNFKHAQKADYLFCVTKAIMLEAELSGMEKQQLFHMPMMVTLPENLQPHCLYQRPPVIGALGHFTRENGFDILLQAAQIMNTRGLRYRLLIAGTGDELPKLEALAEELHITRTVEFAAWPEDIPAFFGEMDIFVSPSHYKHVGYILMQAMAHGLACISTDTEGPGEFLHHTEDALIVERNNPEALALAIERVLTDLELAAEIAGAGQQLMARHYSLDACSIRLQDALNALPNPELNIVS